MRMWTRVPTWRASGLLCRRRGAQADIPSRLLLENYSRHFSTGPWNFDPKSNNKFENVDEFERQFFGGVNDNSSTESFFRKLDKVEKAHGRNGTGSRMNDTSSSHYMDSHNDSFDTLSDGMDAKLRKAASTFAYSDEILEEDYAFRPDVTFKGGMTYTPRDLDLTKPGIQKSFSRYEFETTTEEVLRKADFRNVRFLSNFITEAGIIIKRSQTRISAKAQRKIAREIKTARAFGLMPFTTMGTKPFVFGKLMRDNEQDYEYDVGDYDDGAEPDNI